MNLATNRSGEFKQLPLTNIVLSNYNARKFDQQTPERQRKFEELVASVREQGVIQPIAVRPIETEEGTVYEIMAGERRYRAASRVSEETGNTWATIPAMVYQVSDAEAIAIMTTENLQREDLTPVEEAQAFKAILDAGGNTLDAVKDLAKRVGIAPHAVRLRVSLLNLPQAVLEAWNEGQITTAHVEQLTRVADDNGILAALTECLRRRMTVKELSEFVVSRKPPMKAAKFDTSECAHCVSNGQNQGNLFALNVENAVCANAGCFKAKQGEFIGVNWMTSKAHDTFKTNGFRFQEDLLASEFVVINADLTERCLSCPECVSIVTVVGTGIHGKACVGKRECYDELYAPKKASKPTVAPVVSEQDDANEGFEGGEGEDEDTEGMDAGEGADNRPAAPKAAKGSNESQGPSAEDMAKKAARRTETYRESFYKEAIPAQVATLPPNQPTSIKVTILAFGLSSNSARSVLEAKLGISRNAGNDKDALAAKVFALNDQELLPLLQQMSVAPIMESDFSATSTPKVRDLVAQQTGLDLKAGWVLTKEYLNALNKADIVKMGEEPGVDLWTIPAIVSYRDEKFPKQGWMSLKKGELIACIMESGADLSGRVPEEILTTNRA